LLQGNAQKLADYELTKEEFLGCVVTSTEPANHHVTREPDVAIAKSLATTKKTKTPKSVPPKKKRGNTEREKE